MSTPNRNAPCPCGSGKKYKNCCLKTAIQQAPGRVPLLQAALQQHQAGNLQQAEMLYRQTLQKTPDHPDALHLLGTLYHQAGDNERAVEFIGRALLADHANPFFNDNLGTVYQALNRLDDAVNCYQKALALAPGYAGAHFNLGAVFARQGKLADAETHYREALALSPGHVDARIALGNTFKELGRLDEAMDCYQKALASNPDYAGVHFNLGIVFQEQGKLDEAIGSYRQALSRKPDYAEAHFNLGVVFHEQGRLDEAIGSYRQALSCKADYAEVCSNLGNALKLQGKLHESLACCNKAILLDPDSAAAHCNLGNTLHELGQLSAAAACYHRALSLQPDSAETLGNLGNTYRQLGQMGEALACYRQAYSLKPSDALKIANMLFLPHIMGTKTEVLESRARFERNLDQLIAEGITLPDPCKGFCNDIFYLAFHGLSDKNILQKLAGLYEKACPSLLYMAPHCSKPRPANNKIRIGFLSKFIYLHSVSRCFNRIVEALAQSSKFEVMLISNYDFQEELARKAYPNFTGTHVHQPNQADRAREKIAGLELDILVYLDIGMDPLSYFLAFSRLARVQCVVGGHPVTSGIRNMDYFISSALAEPECGESHYSEKLVRLPIRPSYYDRPVLPATFKTRKELGLPESGNIYACPMRLQKIHPDFDAAIARILQLDAEGHVLLFEDHAQKKWKELLESRFAQTIPADVRNRLLFLPWINNYMDFISMNKAADVVLDPFHFGIGTTAIATYSVGTPVLTWPGEFLRGRIGLQYNKLLELPECVAIDAEDYAKKAVSIASDQALRAGISSRILANAHILFENPQTIEDMENFFLHLEPQLSLDEAIN